jgi:hypothetical protein
MWIWGRFVLFTSYFINILQQLSTLTKRQLFESTLRWFIRKWEFAETSQGLFVMLLWVYIHTERAWKTCPATVGIEPTTFGILAQFIFFKLARCGYTIGYTLRVTSQTSYSPEYTIPTQKKSYSQGCMNSWNAHSKTEKSWGHQTPPPNMAPSWPFYELQEQSQLLNRYWFY